MTAKGVFFPLVVMAANRDLAAALAGFVTTGADQFGFSETLGLHALEGLPLNEITRQSGNQPAGQSATGGN